MYWMPFLVQVRILNSVLPTVVLSVRRSPISLYLIFIFKCEDIICSPLEHMDICQEVGGVEVVGHCMEAG